ncbi:hypothetical protein [Streptomyces cucumeris]|uniref:hypothetical protein n=1 Tax=Streptomyces cucumeris TaxID=2962890 RepID=UPI003D75ECFB
MRNGFMRRLREFAERDRGRLVEMLRAYGSGNAPADYGRYALVGNPESPAICERLETAPLQGV